MGENYVHKQLFFQTQSFSKQIIFKMLWLILKRLRNILDYTNFVDHYQCHDLLVSHPEIEELIFTIGEKSLFAINTDLRVATKVRYLKFSTSSY